MGNTSQKDNNIPKKTSIYVNRGSVIMHNGHKYVAGECIECTPNEAESYKRSSTATKPNCNAATQPKNVT